MLVPRVLSDLHKPVRPEDRRRDEEDPQTKRFVAVFAIAMSVLVYDECIAEKIALASRVLASRVRVCKLYGIIACYQLQLLRVKSF